MNIITGVAWINGGIKDKGIMCVVTINSSFNIGSHNLGESNKAYIKHIEHTTTVEQDAISTARYGGKFPLKIAQDLILKLGSPKSLQYSS